MRPFRGVPGNQIFWRAVVEQLTELFVYGIVKMAPIYIQLTPNHK